MHTTTTPPEAVIQRLTIDLANERIARAQAEARVDHLEAVLAAIPEPEGANP